MSAGLDSHAIAPDLIRGRCDAPRPKGSEGAET